MPVEIKKIPEPSPRPAQPNISRWLTALISMMAIGILLMLLLENNFWRFTACIPVGLWGILLFSRMIIFLIGHIWANAYDRCREQYILKEVRRGRRALQILAAECTTAHASDILFTTISEPLLRNINVLFPQNTWGAAGNVRHSRLTVTEGTSIESVVTTAFNVLLQKLSMPLSALPKDNPVAILLESSSSIPVSEIKAIWLQSWHNSGIKQPIEFIDGQGLAVVDRWLDYRINENTVLLVVALQIAPEEPEMSAETAVGILLGNRLTQKSLIPYALLHRPEASGANAEALQEGLLQAADWVPLQPDAVEHLWLSGIDETSDARASAIIAQGKPPLSHISQEAGLHDFNHYLGPPGRAAPWLAIAAAAKIISDTPTSHMIISGEQGCDTVWSTVISPHVPPQG